MNRTAADKETRCLMKSDEIQGNLDNWHIFADERLADAVFSRLRTDYPDARIIKIGMPYQIQYIAVTEAAKEKLADLLERKTLEHEQMARYMRTAMDSLLGEQPEP